VPGTETGRAGAELVGVRSLITDLSTKKAG
jgi:hypothetical protein